MSIARKSKPEQPVDKTDCRRALLIGIGAILLILIGAACVLLRIDGYIPSIVLTTLLLIYISRLFCEALYPGCFFFVYSLFSLTGAIVFSLHDDRMSGAYMLIAAVLSILTLLLMMYIARKDDSSIGDIKPRDAILHGKTLVMGWQNKKAAAIGTKFVIFPLLLAVILVLYFVPLTHELIAEITGSFLSLSILTYAVRLWDVLTDTWKENTEKDELQR